MIHTAACTTATTAAAVLLLLLSAVPSGRCVCMRASCVLVSVKQFVSNQLYILSPCVLWGSMQGKVHVE